MGAIKFYLNKGKGKPDNRPIMMSYHFAGQRIFYYTGLRIGESQFNQTSKTAWAKSNCIDRLHINTKLGLLRNIVGTIENEYIGKLLTKEVLKSEIDERFKLQKVQTKKKTLLNYFDAYIREIPTKINPQTGRALSATMPAKYKTARNTLEAFFKHTGKEYGFEEINELFYNSFTRYLQSERKLSTNTIGRMMKYIKTVLNDASSQGVKVAPSYRTALKATTEESEQIFLSVDELDLIYKLDLSERPALERVRDLFLVGCWTGLRFSDFTRIQPGDVQHDKIRITQQKTGKPVIIPLIGHAKAIFQKYDNKLPSSISAQKFNKHLKEIGRLAEINSDTARNTTKGGKVMTESKPKHEYISTHTGRRSFATNAYLLGIDPILIMSITGHKTETEFLKYIRVDQLQKAELFEKQFNQAKQ